MDRGRLAGDSRHAGGEGVMTSASKQMRPNKHDPRSDRSQLKSTPASQDGQCPRCACVLVDRGGGEELACPVCGYADYSLVPEPSTRPLVPGRLGRPPHEGSPRDAS